MILPRPLSLLALLAVGAVVGAASSTACGDLKSATGDGTDSGVDAVATSTPDGAAADGSTADASADGPATDSSLGDAGNRGPGPHGSLPTGYCCNDDSECRYRRCVDTTSSGGTGKMCLDECFSQSFCTRPDITFSCVQPDAGQRGLCQPPVGFACIPADQFVRGALPVGACCNAGSAATNDGTAGSACEGNQCAATDTGPLVCTNRCTFQADCPGDYTCTLFGTSKACVPSSASYTCN